MTLLILLAALVGSVLLLRYVMRVPRDYPFRGILLMVATLAFAVLLGASGWQGFLAARKGTGELADARDRYLQDRPADSLGAYVAPYPGASVISVARPAVAGNATPSGGTWTLATRDAPSKVVAHYRTAASSSGWTVEMSAAEFLVLRRAVTTAGARGIERLRIQAKRGRHDGRAATLVEHQLTRRF